MNNEGDIEKKNGEKSTIPMVQRVVFHMTYRDGKNDSGHYVRKQIQK
jgi:hypothetical protein